MTTPRKQRNRRQHQQFCRDRNRRQGRTGGPNSRKRKPVVQQVILVDEDGHPIIGARTLVSFSEEADVAVKVVTS